MNLDDCKEENRDKAAMEPIAGTSDETSAENVNPETPSYNCPACQTVHTSKGAFRMHIHRNHADWKGIPMEAFLHGAMEPKVNSSDGSPLSLEALVAENSCLTDVGGSFCKFCHKVLGKGQVKSHFESLHWSEAPSYHCPELECQKVYTSKGAFWMHIHRNHPNLKGFPLEQFRDDGLGLNLPEIDLSTLSTEILIKPEIFASDENMSEATTSVDSEATTIVNQESFIEGNSNEAVEEPIPGSSEGAKTSLQALIAENTRQTDDGGHFCLICVKGLAPGSVKNHFEDLHWSEAPAYYCPAANCQKRYTAKSAFRSHIKRSHPEWKGVPLEAFLECAKEPIASSSDGAPTSLQALIAEKTYPTAAGGHFCKFCLKVLGKGSVKNHFEDLHWSDTTPYQCPAPECKKVYTAKSAFRSHIKRNHPEWKGIPLEKFKKVDQLAVYVYARVLRICTSTGVM